MIEKLWRGGENVDKKNGWRNMFGDNGFRYLLAKIRLEAELDKRAKINSGACKGAEEQEEQEEPLTLEETDDNADEATAAELE